MRFRTARADLSPPVSTQDAAAAVMYIGAALQPGRGCMDSGWVRVERPSEAVQMLRMLAFDLVLLELTAPEADVWLLAGRIRQFWPWQKWALLVGEEISDEAEIRARAAGAAAVLDLPLEFELLEALLPASHQRADRRDTG